MRVLFALLLCVAAHATGAAIGGGAAVAPARNPAIVTNFVSSSVLQSYRQFLLDDPPTLLFEFEGRIWMDAANQRDMFIRKWTQVGHLMTQKAVQGGDAPYIWMNGRCLNYTQPFTSPFALYAVSSPMGSEEIDGRQCELYNVIVGPLNYTIAVEKESAKPVMVEFVFEDDEGSRMYYVMSYGADLQPVQAFNDTVFAVPDLCYQEQLCEEGPVQDAVFWRMHPEYNATLVNKNVADVLGDGLFLCQIATGLRPSADTVLSTFVVTVNTTWGLYSPCNNDVCMGGSAHLVGREAAEGVKWRGGQCQPNEDTGTWFSLPHTAQCSREESVGPSCAWKLRRRLKSVTVECMMSHGLLDACVADLAAGGTTFSKTAAVMQAAMRSADPASGGCPDLHGHPPGPAALRRRTLARTEAAPPSAWALARELEQLHAAVAHALASL